MHRNKLLLGFLFLFLFISFTTAFNFNNENIIGNLDDVNIISPIDSQTLIYNQSSNTWYNSYLNDSGHSVNNSILWDGHLYGDEGHWDINGNDIYYNDGNVGIGTDTPNSPLHIKSTGGNNNGLTLEATSANLYGTIDFSTDVGRIGQFVTTGSAFTSNIFMPNEMWLTNSYSSGAVGLVAYGANGIIKFGTGGIAAANERMRIDKDGNVGIGTDAPTFKLNVAGTADTDAINSEIGYNIDTVTKPIISTFTYSSGGSVDDGTHYYFVTYTTALGETERGFIAQATVSAPDNTVTLIIPISADHRVTGRKIYRAKAGQPSYSDYLLATISNNVDTEYVDTVADSTLTGEVGAGYFRMDTTTNYITIDNERHFASDSQNVLVGRLAGTSLTSGGRTTLVGSLAGSQITTGKDNQFFGHNAGRLTTTGGANNYHGYSAGYYNTAGIGNVGMGHDALFYSSTGSYNIAIGYLAMLGTSGQSATGNVGIGYNALRYSYGAYNNAMGYQAGFSLTSGYYNNLMGYKAGYGLTTAYYNTLIGHQAGDNLITGGNNIMIGHDVDATSSSGANELNIGDTIYGDISTDKVGIGTATPQNTLDVLGGQVIGSSYAGVNTAPTDGLLVEGDVGIGKTNPISKLHVQDTTDITPDGTGKGHLTITGNGYSGFISLDGTSMYLGHNSAGRDLSFMTNEITRMRIDGSTGYINVDKRIRVDEDQVFGTGTGYWFGNGDTGIYESADNLLRLRLGGVDEILITTSALSVNADAKAARLRLGSISLSNPAYSFRDDSNTGMSTDGSDNVLLVAGGIEAIGVNTTDTIINTRVGINTTSPEDLLQVAGNARIEQSLWVGPKGQFPLGTGDISYSGRVVGNGSLSAFAEPFGIGLVSNNAGTQGDVKISLFNSGSLQAEEQILCDTVINFTEDDVNSYVSFLSSAPVNYADRVGLIDQFINSSCVMLNLGTFGSTEVDNLSIVNYAVVVAPTFLTGDNGIISMNLGENPNAGFFINQKNATGHDNFLMNMVAGVTDSVAVHRIVDVNGFGLVSTLHDIFFSSVEFNNTRTIRNIFTIDLTNFIGGEYIEYEFNLIASNSTKHTLFKVSPEYENLFEVGEGIIISKAWYDDTVTVDDITDNVTTEDQLITVFDLDDSILYFGNEENFTNLQFSLETTSSQDALLLGYYCNSSGEYESLTFSDGTNGFTNQGSISFTNPTNRGICNTEIDGTPFTNSTNYTYVAFQRTRNLIVTPPVLDLVSISNGQEKMFLTKEVIRLIPRTTTPFICIANTIGAIYFDRDEDARCECKSGGWTDVEDGSTCT